MLESERPFRLREVLHMAREMRASDVHLSAGTALTLRVDGSLEMRSDHLVTGLQIDDIVAHCFHKKVRRQLVTTGDATVAYSDSDCGPVRVHAYMVRGTQALAVRMLATEIPALEDLRLPAFVAEFTRQKQGLILITGPTGSGKSTLLAAMIEQINRTQAKHIITIEDPVEYQHNSDRCLVSQREIGKDAASFSSALLGALRSDPDVILVGEMRDRATMHGALGAAETGHLVLCTMHTGSASESVDRIIGTFEGAAQAEVRSQLAEALVGIVCLRLVRRARGLGRVLVAEVLFASDAVRSAIRESKVHHLRNIVATSRSSGMQTMEAHLGDLLSRGEITCEAAREATDRPDEVRFPECTA